MTLEIKPPNQFRHAADLSARFDTADPRKPAFSHERVDVDLRDCEFIRPPAALWCVVFLALARQRGAHCRLLVPSSTPVCMYLKALGLFAVLKDLDVEVDDRDLAPGSGTKTVLPIRGFRSEADATQITNEAFNRLQQAQLGAANMTSIVTELFGELAMNAAQHSESEIGAYACIQFFENFPRFTCTIADGGIGVRAHLCRNPALRPRVNYDWDALELAVRERISGTGDHSRGIGLYGVSEDVRKPNHSLLLHSGLGSLEINEDVESAARRTRLFPGTLAFLSVPA